MIVVDNKSNGNILYILTQQEQIEGEGEKKNMTHSTQRNLRLCITPIKFVYFPNEKK